MIICCRRGNHSKYLAGHFVYPSPRSDTAGFLAELERIAREHEIDVVVPAFEEAFYISTQLERLSRVTKVFVSPFGTLARRALFATVRHCSLLLSDRSSHGRTQPTDCPFPCVGALWSTRRERRQRHHAGPNLPMHLHD